MFGHFYCSVCGTLHDDWDYMDTFIMCNKCKEWKSLRTFNSSAGIADKQMFYYNVPESVKIDATEVYNKQNNMLDWNNVGLKMETVKWINESIVNREQYIRFVVMEFYMEKDYLRMYQGNFNAPSKL